MNFNSTTTTTTNNTPVASRTATRRSSSLILFLLVVLDKDSTMTLETDDTNAMMAGEPSSSAAHRLPLRICCYGSSSARTPEKYTSAAYQLGQTLAVRGHTCVNGAGSAGCMAAMNQGAHDYHGHIVGVIHEKFVVDGSDWFEGAHSVFANKNNKGGGAEILIARGNDLQERKRLLVEGADALVVLPGGPGTWDEVRSFGPVFFSKWSDNSPLSGSGFITVRFSQSHIMNLKFTGIELVLEVVGDGVRQAHWIPFHANRLCQCRWIL